MRAKHIHRKTERTPEEQARLKAVRQWFQKHKPTLEELLASGEYVGPMTMADYLQRKQLFHTLKQEREKAGLSLTDLAERTGIDKAYLSRLENGQQENTTLETLYRYAAALGKEIRFALIDVPAASE
jgi:DNA-binding Xre family transcriptional regulator